MEIESNFDSLIAALQTRAGKRAQPPIPMPLCRAYESIVGIRLPLLLQRVLTEVGNGGFGPGEEGLLSLEDPRDGNVNQLHAIFHQDARSLKRWRKGILPICHWGCMILSCIDLEDDIDDPFVLRFEPNMGEQDTHQYLQGTAFRGIGLFPERDRLSIWFQDWLAGVEMFKRPYKIRETLSAVEKIAED